jgi:hypothetical protein
MTPPARRYVLALIGCMTVYVVFLAVSFFALRAAPAEATAIRAAVGLLPVLPLLMLVRAFARYVREVDEMLRQIELQSVALAALITGIAYMVVGFLVHAEVFAVRADMVAILVLPCLFCAYGIAKAIVQRSYGG